MGKNVLVTGGAGFLGSFLCNQLIKKGENIFCVDNLYTSNIENINHLIHHKRFKFLNYNIINNFEINEDIDEIYNFACPASPIHYQKDPLFTLKTCFSGSINLLELAKQKKSKILQASTSEIYGDPDIHPQTEEYRGNVNPIGIRACYDEGKRVAETLFFNYKRMYEIPIKIVRIFNTYGPGMAINDGRVISNFIVQALTGENLTIYGSGLQTRSFCYVSDLINGIIKTMDTDKEITGPINLGNPVEYTIIEIAELIIKLTRSKSKIEFKKLPEDDPKKRKPDISKARKILDWKPEVSIVEGLSKTINYFKKKL